MAVLNATPDSFSDGGRFGSADALVEHALRCVEAGADAIDVGGESTRPGAARVSAAEQIDRTAVVIERLRAASDVVISIDTTRAAVAEAALDAGADAINDVSAGREDDAMLPLAGGRGCGLVLMHRLRPPDEDSYSHAYDHPPEYDDVVAEVCAFLRARGEAARAAGVARDAIVVDPGLGFGKSVEQNFELIARTAEIVATGFPVLGAASRKSFIGAVTGVADPAGRDAGSVAASVVQHAAGVRLFRVHDVAGHAQALAVARAVGPAGGRNAPARETVG
jgi:dihydropteroate synthase